MPFDYDKYNVMPMQIDAEKASKFMGAFDGITNAEAMALLCWGLATAYQSAYCKKMTPEEFIGGVVNTLQGMMAFPENEIFSEQTLQ